jgi:putative addiction module killer protein
VLEVRRTSAFRDWLHGLRDDEAAVRIFSRIDRLARGNPGDVKPVGDGVSEMRIHHGPGYRIYFQQKGTRLLIILCGGDKTTQKRDIEAAKRLAKEWRDDP